MIDKVTEESHILTPDEVKKSLEIASTDGQAEAFAQGTISALTGGGDPTYLQKIRRRIEGDKLRGEDPRGKYVQTEAAKLLKKK